MFQSQDFKELLNLFKKYNVKYLVVGGYAVMKYTEPRFTKDIDLWIETSKENAKAVFAALKEFGAPLLNLSEKDFTESGYFYQMGRAPFRVDIMMSIPGVKFEEAYQKREVSLIQNIEVSFISKEDLIKSKIASGREIDQNDLKKLLK